MLPAHMFHRVQGELVMRWKLIPQMFSEAQRSDARKVVLLLSDGVAYSENVQHKLPVSSTQLS